ncbi:MAG: cysteine desulfurase NifS [Oscillospiraceae bacterium]|nr:cysteine desulfurase NifS [Oscillospiraceae bacterium]
METRQIYADHAATTAVSDEVLAAMLPYFQTNYGNPSSIYALGRENERAVMDARARVAACLGAQPSEIFFTAGGSESDNWAIKGAADALAAKGKRHIITTVFEHHAVLHTCEFLEKHGFEVTYLPVSPEGLVTAQQVADAIREDTALVTVMYANNEIGTIQPIAEIGQICRERGVWFHTDAVQAVGNVPIDVKAQNIDMLSLSGHKFHAPKGVGALYIRKGVRIPNLIHGGGQEAGRRAGTENVPGIIGLARALEIATQDIEGKIAYLTPLRDQLIDGILKIDQTRLNGSREARLCGNVNISIVGVEGESLLLLLDGFGIRASSGSACTSGSLDPSHVLLSLGLIHEVAHGSLRLSFDRDLTQEDVDYILDTIPKVVDRLRGMSPMWETICKEGKRLV